ncbi:MAG: ABC transporter ATP-binding protein [Proteobacteria bacterium]|nr:ABC transporter ATP-binding protein [Pseudomonadota bacterium]
MLEVKDLWVGVDGKEILKGVDLVIGDRGKHVLFGPNGVGKSCLAMTIMGIPTYRITKGNIFFNGKDVTTLPINERAALGIGMAFQNPPAIRGVKLGDFLTLCGGDVDKHLEKSFLDRSFKDRDLNLGFSGGERKRSELAQLFAMEPELMLLDEIDSGVDINSLGILGKELNSFLSERSSLIITHHGYILKYLKPDMAHVLLNGRIVRSGDFNEILHEIEENGFEGNKDG